MGWRDVPATLTFGSHLDVIAKPKARGFFLLILVNLLVEKYVDRAARYRWLIRAE